MQDDLLFLYQQLRQQLDVAYADLQGNRARIDRIALDLLSLERSLAMHSVRLSQLSDLCEPADHRERLVKRQA